MSVEEVDLQRVRAPLKVVPAVMRAAGWDVAGLHRRHRLRCVSRIPHRIGSPERLTFHMTGNLRWTSAGARVRFAPPSTWPSLLEASFRTADRTDHLESASSGIQGNSAQTTSYDLPHPMGATRARFVPTELDG